MSTPILPASLEIYHLTIYHNVINVLQRTRWRIATQTVHNAALRIITKTKGMCQNLTKY